MTYMADESGGLLQLEDGTFILLEAGRSMLSYITDAGGYANTAQTRSISLGTLAVGDLIILVSYFPNASNIVRQPTVTGGGAVAWTPGPALPVSGTNSGGAGDNYAYVGLWSGVVTTAGAVTLGMYKEFNEGYPWGTECTVWRNATLGAIAVYQDTPSTSSDGSVSLTTKGNNSAVIFGSNDWVPVDGASRVARSVNSQAPTGLLYYRDPNFYTVYGYRYEDAGLAGTNRYGLSSPTGQRAAGIAIEIQ